MDEQTVKLKIRGEGEDKQPKVPELEVFLERDEDSGVVWLVVREADGTDWTVAGLRSDGVLSLVSSIPHDIGLKLEKGSEIQIVRGEN